MPIFIDSWCCSWCVTIFDTIIRLLATASFHFIFRSSHFIQFIAAVTIRDDFSRLHNYYYLSPAPFTIIAVTYYIKPLLLIVDYLLLCALIIPLRYIIHRRRSFNLFHGMRLLHYINYIALIPIIKFTIYTHCYLFRISFDQLFLD